MDLTLLRGCCLWRGGVMLISKENGFVICNDGGVSEECTFINPKNRSMAW